MSRVTVTSAADSPRREDGTTGDRGLSAFSPIRVRRAADEVVAVLVDAVRGGL